MKQFRFILALGLILPAACRRENSVCREVEIVAASPGRGLNQELAANEAVIMLASDAYANEVLHRLSPQDARFFANKEDLQKRLSVTATAEGKRIRIAFKYPDALVAERVAAAYEACLVQNWVGAVNLGFRVLPADEYRAIQRPESNAGATSTSTSAPPAGLSRP